MEKSLPIVEKGLTDSEHGWFMGMDFAPDPSVFDANPIRVRVIESRSPSDRVLGWHWEAIVYLDGREVASHGHKTFQDARKIARKQIELTGYGEYIPGDEETEA